MSDLLQETWIQVQRAETLLIQTAAYANREQYRAIFANVSLKRDPLQLLLRTTYGCNLNGFQPEDYLARYPYSSVAAIQAALEELVAAGFMDKLGLQLFAPNDAGKQVVYHHMQEIGRLINTLDLGQTTGDDIQKLLAYNHQIVEGLIHSERPHGNPILSQRLQGLHPQYESRQLWHHWQLAWTMIAAREDEEEFIRQKRQTHPLVWYVRRQIWFTDRQPWLARALTFEQLLQRAVGYAPVENAKEALTDAIHHLQEEGWLREAGDEFRLTEAGLATQDHDEAEVITNFLARWPALSPAEAAELQTIAFQLNEHLANLRRQLQVS